MLSKSSRPSSRALSFYVVLFLMVGPVYAFVPFAWAFALHGLWTGAAWSYTPFQQLVFLWACIEIVFSLYYAVLARRVASTGPPPPPDAEFLKNAFVRVLKAGMAGFHEIKPQIEAIEGLSQDEEQDLKECGNTPRILSTLESIDRLEFDDPRAKDYRECMRTWFHKKPWADIHRHELRQWVYWSSFSSHMPPLDKVDPLRREMLEEGIALIEKRAGCSIPEGSNPSCRPVLVTLDPVTILSRPLLFYGIVRVATHWLELSFCKFYGFKYGGNGDFEYLVRVPKIAPGKTKPRPLMFLHGLGLGLLQYHQLVKSLVKELPNHPIIIPLQPHISQNIFHPRFLSPLKPAEAITCITKTIVEMGWTDTGVDILSHSNGTFYHSWILKACPELVRRSCFVDPVTFCSWEGDVCYNFVYQPCVTGVELVMRYFVGTEVGVSNTLQRHFDWSANSLFFEEIPDGHDHRKVTFFLAGKDAILDAKRVQRYLQSHGVRKGLWLDPKARHGEALISGGKGMHEIVTWLREEYP